MLETSPRADVMYPQCPSSNLIPSRCSRKCLLNQINVQCLRLYLNPLLGNISVLEGKILSPEVLTKEDFHSYVCQVCVCVCDHCVKFSPLLLRICFHLQLFSSLQKYPWQILKGISYLRSWRRRQCSIMQEV